MIIYKMVQKAISQDSQQKMQLLEYKTTLNLLLTGLGLNNVCAYARSHSSSWRQRPGHHHKPRKNGGVFKKFRMVSSLW